MRDMYVEIPGHGHNKLNAAYAFGGVELLYQTIAKNFGIKIDNYCVVDFSTFEKVINKVGGVEISLEEKEAKYLNTTNYISKKKYRNVKVGKQTLNGNQALGYARVRYVVSKKYGDGDFGRTGRQRAVLQAALNKVLQAEPNKDRRYCVRFISRCINRYECKIPEESGIESYSDGDDRNRPDEGAIRRYL